MRNDYPYDDTIDESPQRSMEKALAILEEQKRECLRKASNTIVRPDVSIKKGLMAFVTVLSMLSLSFWLLSFYLESLAVRVLIVSIVSAMLFCFFARRIIVWLIHVYQKIAPDELRLSCVFEPSCSEYMLLTIEKYGILYGVGKGIKRLLRCRYPNGGVDNP